MQKTWLRGDVPIAEEPAIYASRGVFETLRWHDGPPPAWLHHQARWDRGLAGLGLPPLALADLLAQAQQFLREGTPWRVRLTAYSPGVVELAWRPLLAEDLQPAQWHLRTMGELIPPPPEFVGCKITDLRALATWRTCAQELGADEALLLGPDRQWSEATTANLLVGLDDGRVVTPGPEAGALPGSTLDWLRDRMPIDDERLDATILPHVRWAVLTNAIALIRPVAAIDGQILQSPPAMVLALRDQLTRPAM
jgi:branched-subunit amino acid aminotransferase/4-amino-4-deoxychorismate lyase